MWVRLHLVVGLPLHALLAVADNCSTSALVAGIQGHDPCVGWSWEIAYEKRGASRAVGPFSDPSPEVRAAARDIAAIRRISAVPTLLSVICDFTGLGFAAVARVTEDSWTACAVLDQIGLGVKTGDQLDLSTTLCTEVRQSQSAIIIDQASTDPIYSQHHTPRLYGFESYISVPILRKDGSYFGNLCALDPKPAEIKTRRTQAMFETYAELIALQLETEDTLEQAEAALTKERENSALREEFIAVLGHDLRNPLAAISNSAALLVARQSDPLTTQVAVRLRSAAVRMAGLIDEVMDYARGRLGTGIGLNAAPVDDLGDALHDVIEEMRAAHPGRDIAERLAIDGPVFCDRARLQQLLSNLLGNAFHHGAAEGSVGVDATLADGWVEIRVRNAGTPIPAESLSRLFDPYWRAGGPAAANGLGLGLYICQQVIKAHGGTLQVSSTAESGTCFMARFPAV